MHNTTSEFYMYSVQSPCKECPKCGCGSYHDKCEKYLKFKADLEIAKAKNKDLNEISSFHGIKGLGNHYVPKYITNKTGYRNDHYH